MYLSVSFWRKIKIFCEFQAVKRFFNKCFPNDALHKVLQMKIRQLDVIVVVEISAVNP